MNAGGNKTIHVQPFYKLLKAKPLFCATKPTDGYMYKNFLRSGSFFFLLTLAIACKTTPKDDPKAVAEAFTEALIKEDFDGAAKYATRESQSTIEMLKSAAKITKMFGGKEGELNADFFQGAKGKELTYTDPTMDGTDRATISVMADGKEIRLLILKREETVWKVAIDISTIMDVERTNIEDATTPILNQADSVIDNLQEMTDSISDELQEAQKQLDSLKKE